MTEWMSEWVIEWVNEWVSEWVSLWVRDFSHILPLRATWPAFKGMYIRKSKIFSIISIAKPKINKFLKINPWPPPSKLCCLGVKHSKKFVHICKVTVQDKIDQNIIILRDFFGHNFFPFGRNEKRLAPMDSGHCFTLIR